MNVLKETLVDLSTVLFCYDDEHGRLHCLTNRTDGRENHKDCIEHVTHSLDSNIIDCMYCMFVKNIFIIQERMLSV